jgi:hypothetical protein
MLTLSFKRSGKLNLSLPFLKHLLGGSLEEPLLLLKGLLDTQLTLIKSCSVCGIIENDIHLLFLCDFSREVWNDSSFNFPLHLLDPAEDGVQAALSILLTPTSGT